MELTKEEKTYGMLSHLVSFAGYIIPLGNIIGPLVVWLLKKNESSYVDYHGKESLNFQISILIYVVVSIILSFVLIGIPLLIALAIFDIVVVIIAAIRANDGEYYQYPLCIRFLK